MPSRGETLLNVVYEHPDNLGARRSYADWLVEQGDLRGEFIALQCARADRGNFAVERREVELLLEHGRDWLGPFARSIKLFTFERGFLSTCELKSVSRAMIGHPSWATLRKVAFDAFDGEKVAAFLSSPVMRSLREAGGVGPQAFAELQAPGRGARLTRLHVVGVAPIPLERARTRGGLPDLEELRFD